LSFNNWPDANPATSIYNARVVNFYNATGSPARFENKNILFYFDKRSSLLQRWRCSCEFKSRRIGSWFENRMEGCFSNLNMEYKRGKEKPSLKVENTICSDSRTFSASDFSNKNRRPRESKFL
jgi:hypothetical protein